ncbi:hypothetical protein Pst134EA_030320 [Puccinia striiformis f. sp. tritici]|uniref:hypothetical protein n=1 Tax=Puccinia striiformis f. sp. tritici TaxID=168172 RepID=UPI00200767D7|nr:hypothetical protein Pst134EA_030320 [Puccinia striiformis f. sp. tritici]KAH9440240.1 hypothetical protein Pst134EB_030865 [Puccinia striiformis f. sp. tritici]KAH9446400.1 hypothetical protein Pst134EA_030320 [Puccinia striiformis f. sp. tritici]KAI9599907.1 hypothetical protein KEM48_000015 [Puccinia striiformis f. sp. tritici PST-130]
MQISTFFCCLLAIVVQVRAGSPPPPASVPVPAPPTPLSPYGFPCPPKAFGVCAYAIPIPPPTVIHRNIYPTVYLLDATEDKHKNGTEPSCCGDPMNKFTAARGLWIRDCPPNQTK